MLLKDFIKQAEAQGVVIEGYDKGAYTITRNDEEDNSPLLIAFIEGWYSLDIENFELENKDLKELTFILKNETMINPSEDELKKLLKLI